MRAPSKRPSVLVVEDSRDVREMLERFLAAHGFAVTTASNGREGIDLYGTAQPDIVVTDLSMPEADGLELAVTLRGSGSATPIVLLTAFDVNGERASAFAKLDQTRTLSKRQLALLVPTLHSLLDMRGSLSSTHAGDPMP